MVLNIPLLVNKYNIKIKGILHIGAHFGEENGLYDYLGITNRIFFEPLKSNYEILKNNIGEEHLSLNIALGNENKRILMNVETANKGQSSSILKPSLHLVQYPNIKFETTEEVEMKKLDSLDIDLSNFNAINIDVQGYELEVFKGAKQALKHIDYIIAEINRDEVYQDCALINQLIDFLSPYGFELVEQEWYGGIWGEGLFIKKHSPSNINNKISLICACKNRLSALKISLASWLEHKEIQEIIIVDWSSDQPIQDSISFNPKVKIIRVENQKYFNLPQPLNLALSLASYDTILKVDCDYIFNIYEGYNFFQKYGVDDYCFVCGEAQKEIDDTVRPYFTYLRGLLYIKKKFLEKIGGWNEKYREYYGGDDGDIIARLVKYGLEKKYINLDYTLIHMPHSSKERIANFEGNNNHNMKEYIRGLLIQENIKHNPSIIIPTDEDRWNWETNLKAMAEYHAYYNVSNNKTTNYWSESTTIWEIEETGFQRYLAKIK